jgi:hypothetical protein
VCLTNAAWQKEKAAGVNRSSLRQIVVAHTGQSSQLFAIATVRNAQFLPTVASSTGKLLRRTDYQTIIDSLCIVLIQGVLLDAAGTAIALSPTQGLEALAYSGEA